MKNFYYLCLISFILVLLPACSSKKNNPFNQTILYNLSGDPKTLDPQVAEDVSSQIVDINIFEGLTRIDSNDNVVPGVALNWESNDEHTSFKFFLRHDATWSDKENTPVTSKDFVFGLRRSVSPSTNSSSADILYPIKGARDIIQGKKTESDLGVYAVDDYTLIIDLEYPYEDFPRVLSSLPAMPCNEKFFENTNAQYGLESTTIISNGPFKIRNRYGWEHGKTLYLLRNDNYCGDNPAIPAGVTFSINQNVTNLVDAVNQGITDAGELSDAQFNMAQKLKYNITSFEDVTWGLSFNFVDDLFKNHNMRKSFIQCLNRNKILSSIPDGVNIANDIIPYTAVINGKSYREQAGSNFYLKQMDSVDSMLNKGMKELGIKKLSNIKITCLNDNISRGIANNMIEIWNDIMGIYMNIEPVSSGKLSDKIQVGDFQIVVAPLYSNSNDPVDILETFKTNSQNNICDMRSSEFDNMVDKIKDLSNADRLNYCVQSEKYLNDNAAFYPLYYSKRHFASAPNVTDIVFYKSSSLVSFIRAVKIKK